MFQIPSMKWCHLTGSKNMLSVTVLDPQKAIPPTPEVQMTFDKALKLGVSKLGNF